MKHHWSIKHLLQGCKISFWAIQSSSRWRTQLLLWVGSGCFRLRIYLKHRATRWEGCCWKDFVRICFTFWVDWTDPNRCSVPHSNFSSEPNFAQVKSQKWQSWLGICLWLSWVGCFNKQPKKSEVLLCSL